MQLASFYFTRSRSFSQPKSDEYYKGKYLGMWNRIFYPVLIVPVFVSSVFCCYLPLRRSGRACSHLEPYLVDRDDWDADEPTGPMECLWSPVQYVIMHHTVTGDCNSSSSCSESMRRLQKDHTIERRWPDVGYHFVIGGDGKAYAGRPWNRMGGHTKNMNRKSIGIAFLGNYDKDIPERRMLDLVSKITDCGVEKGYLHPTFVIIGHKDAYCSSCPGEALYDVIKDWPQFSLSVPIPSYSCENIKTTTKKPTTTATTTTKKPTTTTKKPTTTTKKPTTTTKKPTTTTTTKKPTTTTEKPTTTTTTKKPERKEKTIVVKALPIYVYLSLPKKPFKCCYADEWWPFDK